MTAAAISALRLDLSQHDHSWFWQNQHDPQQMVNGMTTRSPFLRFLTSLPTSSTMPIGSWPMMSPDFIVGMNPSYRCRSDPQMAVDLIRTTASLESSIFASRTVSNTTSPVPCQTIAFIGRLLIHVASVAGVCDPGLRAPGVTDP